MMRGHALHCAVHPPQTPTVLPRVTGGVIPWRDALHAGFALRPGRFRLDPPFNATRSIRRALQSLQAQTLDTWEAIVVDDGSTEDPAALASICGADRRIRLIRRQQNGDMGAAPNVGLDGARAPAIAYLPVDGLYYADHLRSLVATLVGADGAVLAHAGVRHHYNRWADGQIEGYPLQCVQVMHWRGPERWATRSEFVTDDLERMFWGRLRGRGSFRSTGQVTCEWVDHLLALEERGHRLYGLWTPESYWFNTIGPLPFGHVQDIPLASAR